MQNWCHRRRVVARGSESWDALDRELSDGEWELPSHVQIRLGAVRGLSLLLRVCLLSYTHLLSV